MIRAIKMPDSIRIVCISDTHNLTDRSDFPSIPEADILIHTGDFTICGKTEDVIKFNDWLGTLPHEYKVVIAGNHEKTFDPLVPDNDPEKVTKIKRLLTNCIYLEESSVFIKGIKFYGAPFTRKVGGSTAGFQLGSKGLEDKWSRIPSDTDILMTHGPPFGFGDLTKDGNQGCKFLMKEISERIQPKLHVFGHIHEAAGLQTNGATIFINAAICNTPRDLHCQQPIVLDFNF